VCGVPGVKTAQEATVFYIEQAQKLLAKRVLVGINLPRTLEELGEGKSA